MGHGGIASRERRHARRAAERAAARAHRSPAVADPPQSGPAHALQATGTEEGAAVAVDDGAKLGAAAPVTLTRTGSRRESGRARQRRQRQAEAAGSPLFALKLEACRELGLEDKLKEVGWGGLSAAEAGRVGAYVTRMLRSHADDAADGG